MEIKVIETCNVTGFVMTPGKPKEKVLGNWGKFMVLVPTEEEWARRPQAPDTNTGNRSLLSVCGWGPEHVWVLDLQTGEGMYTAFGRGREPAIALEAKHQIWVCPMYVSFLNWLNEQISKEVSPLSRAELVHGLPDYVELADAPFDFSGYRRSRGGQANEPT